MKTIIRLAVTAGLALMAAGCSADFTRFFAGVGTVAGTVAGATVPGYTVIAAAQTFDGSQLVAAAYLRLPICRPTSGPACRVRSATSIIKGAFAAGRIARNELKVQLRAACAAEFAARTECTAGIPVASYNTLVAATRTIDDATAAWRAATGK